jgi:predicted nucleic acid-binding protein
MPGDMLDIVVIPIKIVPVDQRAVLYSSIYHGIYRMKPEAWVACSPGRVEELFVNLTRKVPKPLPAGEVASLVEDISAWTIHSPGPGDVLSAIELHERVGISFWDAMILTSARTLGCRTLYSEDLNAGQTYDGVRVVNPIEESAKL